ncbi:MAG: pyroglutamyl-peptidase I [Thermofilaceae archaeon]
MARILLTGFEPFGGEEVNPSAIVAKKAAEELINHGYDVHMAILPVSFKRAGTELTSLLNENRPEIAISLGLYGGASHLRLERVAVNIKDASKPDNDGWQPVDEPIDPIGPAAYFSTLPLRKILEKLKEKGIPATISYSAGTFLCNFTMYTLLRHADLNGYPKRAGFIHVAYTPDIVARKMNLLASLPLKLQVKAIKLTVELSL